ncbi:MAG: hypothetical protein Q7T48_12935 [Cellvibrio sp.]|uniref:hypothetical protein n=1 Tax=Cellvibrio sp. TaxID=1965322 RepID=UPI002716D4DF|nr:hypothetical protein [Cellvibrio sp.]
MKTNDAVLLSALRVPYEMAQESELGRKIFYSQAQLAADRIVADATRIVELEAALAAALLAQLPLLKVNEQPVSDTVANQAVADASVHEAKEQLSILSDQQILDIAHSGKLLIRNSEIALRFARAVLEAARIERLSDEKIVKIARATKTPIQTGKGALRFSRILLAEVSQLNAA